jgi:hypothetical protein
MDLTNTIVPKSDQLNSDELITGPRTFTITDVREGSSEQPINIMLAESPGKPFRPSKTALRVLVTAWGKESSVYIGRRLTLYRDADVKWAGQAVGGIRVSHLSHIDKPMKMALTETRGKKVNVTVQPLPDAPKPADVPDYAAEANTAQDAAGVREVWERAKAAGHLSEALKKQLTAIGAAIAGRAKAPADEATLPGVDQ